MSVFDSPTCSVCRQKVGWSHFAIFDHVNCRPPVPEPAVVPTIALDHHLHKTTKILSEMSQLLPGQVAEVLGLKPAHPDQPWKERRQRRQKEKWRR